MQDELKQLKALADGNRLRVIAALMQHEELCACQITELLQVTGATTSRHLSVLRSAGLTSSRKDGRWVYYRLTRPAGSEQLFQWLEQTAKGSATNQKDSESLKTLLKTSPDELCRQQRGVACCPQ